MGKGVSAAPRQICILRMSTPGEVALTLPAVTLLSRHFPGARITYLTSTDCVPVLAAGLPAGIHIEGLPLPRGAGDYGEFRRLYAGENFDLLLAMQSSLRVNFLYPLIRARTKLGLPEELSGDGYGMFVKQRLPSVVGHQAETLMEFAFAAGVPRGGAEWSLRLDPAAVTAARQRSNGARTLAIAPGTADPACAWPLDRMAALARRAQDQLGLRVVLLGNSEAEREAARFVKGEVNGVLDASAAPLPEQFANLASARALVSADTDAVAFARCFSTPVVGLYASSRMDWCGPHLATKFCLDKYAEALQLVSKKEVDKFPRNHRIRDARAMALISLDEVLEQLNAALASRGG